MAYGTIDLIAQGDRLPARQLAAQRALEDGFLSNREYRAVIDMDRTTSKDRALARWAAE